MTHLFDLGARAAGCGSSPTKNGRTPAGNCESPTSSAADHRLRRQTSRGQLADLELRHRRRDRCEDRSRCGKDTELTDCLARLRAESGLVRDRGAGSRTHRLDADPRPRTTIRPDCGTRKAEAAAARHPRPARPHRRPATSPPRGECCAVHPAPFQATDALARLTAPLPAAATC